MERSERVGGQGLLEGCERGVRIGGKSKRVGGGCTGKCERGVAGGGCKTCLPVTVRARVVVGGF